MPKRFTLFFVYILFSEKFDRYYVGQTNDTFERLKRHNSRKEKSTAPCVPWELVWKTSKPTRAEAMLLEKKLKNLSKDRIKTFIKKYPSELEVLTFFQKSGC